MNIDMRELNAVVKEYFISTLHEVESLQDFYTNFMDCWNNNKTKFESEHHIGLCLQEILSNLYDCDNPEKSYETMKKETISGHFIEDIINLSFHENDNESDVDFLYSMKKGFSKQDPQEAKIEKSKIESQLNIFSRSILSNIVIIFEMYLSHIYQFLVLSNPEKYFEGKTIKLSSIFSDTASQIIANEVENKMYDSLNTLDKMYEKNGFNIDRYTPVRKEFEEIYFRRNILVHNFGIVNDKYLDSVDKKFKENIKCGDKLVCDQFYMENAITNLKKIICVLFYELLRVLKFNDENINFIGQNIAFSALSNGEYALCEYVYDILRKDKTLDFSNRTMYEINYMLALKHQNKPIKHILDTFDVSAMQEKFVIAKHCLEENFSIVYVMLSENYGEYFSARAIRDWPLFIDFRRTDLYNRFRNEHIEDFKQYAFDSPEVMTDIDTSSENEYTYI